VRIGWVRRGARQHWLVRTRATFPGRSRTSERRVGEMERARARCTGAHLRATRLQRGPRTRPPTVASPSLARRGRWWLESATPSARRRSTIRPPPTRRLLSGRSDSARCRSTAQPHAGRPVRQRAPPR
jgi:hypothetical protein